MEVSGVGVLCTLLLSGLAVGPDRAPDRLYGRVLTVDGEVVEGFLRWDRNEASWADFLDGAKEIPLEHIREAERLDPEFAERRQRERSVVAFGVRITWDEDDQADPPAVDSGIRFAHIESLVVEDDRYARLRLRGGGEVRLRSASSDLGGGMRDLVIERTDGSVRELDWSDIDRVDFMPAPAGSGSPGTERLHGTVSTWGGLDLTGTIAWDLDEIFTDDILDGRSGGRDHEIRFGDIEAIEWESARSARVLLRSGEEMVLRGSNDVDRSNRGIEVSGTGFGRAVVRWEDFRSLRLHADRQPVAWPAFAPGDAVTGTVYARDGRAVQGAIRWNNVKTRAWELLGGWHDDTRFDIELGAIRSIAKVAPDRVVVTLHGGRTFELEDSDDVDEQNLGILVQQEGRASRLVRWRDFERLELVGSRGQGS